MESNKPLLSIDPLRNLLGELTDFESDSSFDKNNLDELKTHDGNFVEKYFNPKLKHLLKKNKAFSNTIIISEVHDDIILSINYAINE
jgi:hypothetical protein